MHPQHYPEAWEVHIGSISSMKYPSIVNTLSVQGVRGDKSSPKSNDDTVFSITCQSS